MKIARSKIQHYITQMTLFLSKAMAENNIRQDFYPNKIINIAVSAYSILHKTPTITVEFPNDMPKVSGNPAVYLEAITMLLNGVTKYAAENIYLHLQFYKKKEKITYVLIVSLPHDKCVESILRPSSLNCELSYDFFIIRKMLNKIDGSLFIQNQKEYSVDFIVEVDFDYAEEGAESFKNELIYNYGAINNNRCKVTGNATAELRRLHPYHSLKNSEFGHDDLLNDFSYFATNGENNMSDTMSDSKLLGNQKQRTNKEIKLSRELINRDIDALFLERQKSITTCLKLKNKIKHERSNKRLRQKKMEEQKVNSEYELQSQKEKKSFFHSENAKKRKISRDKLDVDASLENDNEISMIKFKH